MKKQTLNEEISRIGNLINFFKKKSKDDDDESEISRFTCTDCGEYDYKMYMVNDELWNQHGTGRDTLCMSCFQKRIGRDLSKNDFTDHKDAFVNLHNDDVQNLMNY